MWINPQALSGGDSVVLGKFWNPTMTSPYYQYGLELAGGTVPVFYIGTTGGPLSASMGSALPLNQWSYLAVVFDGSQAQFYVNGALITTASLPATITARGNPLQLGADNNLAQFFKGSLDDVRIYDRFLTQAEIQTDMVTSLGAPDTIAPTVQAINRVGLTPTNAGSVQWTVTFSESVTGVDITDFQLAPSGVTGAALTSVTPVSGTTYTVTASTGTGSGTLGLNLVDDNSILDSATNPLGGLGAGNGNFTGQAYTIDKTAPTGTVVINGGAAATNSRNVTLTLSATDALSGVTQMRFSNTGTSFSAAEAYAPTKAWTLHEPAPAPKSSIPSSRMRWAIGPQRQSPTRSCSILRRRPSRRAPRPISRAVPPPLHGQPMRRQPRRSTTG